MKKKYTGANLNAQLRGSNPKKNSNNNNSFITRTRRGRQTVIGLKPGDSSNMKSAIPKPINTMSLRKENKGQDTTIEIVPAGGSGWVKATPTEEPKPEPAPVPAPMLTTSKDSIDEPSKPVWSKDQTSTNQPMLILKKGEALPNVVSDDKQTEHGWASDEEDTDYPALGAPLVVNKRANSSHSKHPLNESEFFAAVRRELPSGPQMGGGRYSDSGPRTRSSYYQDNHENRNRNGPRGQRENYQQRDYQDRDRNDNRRQYNAHDRRSGYGYGGFNGPRRGYDDNRGYDNRRTYDDRRQYDNRRQYDDRRHDDRRHYNSRAYDDRNYGERNYGERRWASGRPRPRFEKHEANYYDKSGGDPMNGNHQREHGFPNSYAGPNPGETREFGDENYRRSYRSSPRMVEDETRQQTPKADTVEDVTETGNEFVSKVEEKSQDSKPPNAENASTMTTDLSTSVAAATSEPEVNQDEDTDLDELMKRDQHAYMKELARRKKAQLLKVEEEKKRTSRQKALETGSQQKQEETGVSVSRHPPERKAEEKSEQEKHDAPRSGSVTDWRAHSILSKRTKIKSAGEIQQAPPDDFRTRGAILHREWTEPQQLSKNNTISSKPVAIRSPAWTNLESANTHSATNRVMDNDAQNMPKGREMKNYETKPGPVYTRIMARPSSRPVQKKLFDPKQAKFVDVPEPKTTQPETIIMRAPSKRPERVKTQRSRDNETPKKQITRRRSKKDTKDTQKIRVPAKGAARIFFQQKVVAPKIRSSPQTGTETKSNGTRATNNRYSRSKHTKSKRSSNGVQSKTAKQSKATKHAKGENEADKQVVNAAQENARKPTKSVENAWASRNLIKVLKSRIPVTKQTDSIAKISDVKEVPVLLNTPAHALTKMAVTASKTDQVSGPSMDRLSGPREEHEQSARPFVRTNPAKKVTEAPTSVQPNQEYLNIGSSNAYPSSGQVQVGEAQHLFHLEDNDSLSDISKNILESTQPTQPLSVSVDYSQLRLWAPMISGEGLGGMGAVQPGTWSDTPIQAQASWSNPGPGLKWSDPGSTPWSGPGTTAGWEQTAFSATYSDDLKPKSNESPKISAVANGDNDAVLDPQIKLSSKATPHKVSFEPVRVDKAQKTRNSKTSTKGTRRRGKTSRKYSKDKYSRLPKRLPKSDKSGKSGKPTKAGEKSEKGKPSRQRSEGSNENKKKPTKTGAKNSRSSKNHGSYRNKKSGNRGGSRRSYGRGRGRRNTGPSKKASGSNPVRRINPVVKKVDNATENN